jgi:hypothetical protein
MKKYLHGIENLIYAAEIACDTFRKLDRADANDRDCKDCPFQDFFTESEIKADFFECRLLYLRRWCGVHVEQSDIPEVKLTKES